MFEFKFNPPPQAPEPDIERAKEIVDEFENDALSADKVSYSGL
jgi:hypothetical protein